MDHKELLLPLKLIFEITSLVQLVLVKKTDRREKQRLETQVCLVIILLLLFRGHQTRNTFYISTQLCIQPYYKCLTSTYAFFE